HHKDQQRDSWIGIGTSWFKRATVSHAKQPDADFQRALEALDRATQIDRNHFVPYFYEGRIYEAMAQRARASGRDPGADLQKALAAYNGGLAINATMPLLHNGVGAVFQALAGTALERGEDPTPLLDRAQAAFEQAIAEAPKLGDGYNNSGEVQLQRA